MTVQYGRIVTGAVGANNEKSVVFVEPNKFFCHCDSKI